MHTWLFPDDATSLFAQRELDPDSKAGKGVRKPCGETHEQTQFLTTSTTGM